VEDGRREQIKNKLLEGIKSTHMEKYRKNDEEVGACEPLYLGRPIAELLRSLKR